MLGQTILERDLDEFIQHPPYKGTYLLQPSQARRVAYGGLLLLATLLAITGVARWVDALTQPDGSAISTAQLALGALLLVAAAGLFWRFSTPFVFAVLLAEDGLAWRTLLGWHHVTWEQVRFVLVQPHSVFGGREAFIGTDDGRLSFGWFDVTDWYTFGPLKALPADEAKALLHAIVKRAGLARREPGKWARKDDTCEISTGLFRW